jgi:hypothetical protein
MIIYKKKSYKAHCVCHITSKAKSQKHQDDENYNWEKKSAYTQGTEDKGEMRSKAFVARQPPCSYAVAPS